MIDISLQLMLVQALSLLSGILAVVILWANSRMASPTLAIFWRWARWICIATSVATILHQLGYQSHDPWVVALATFMGWFLLESVYSWMAVTALSHSELPLFPRYLENESGNEWPAQERFIRMRAWLRRKGFQRIQALIAKVEEQIFIHISVYESEDKRTRTSIIFFPNARGNAAVAFSFHSLADDGIRLVTDNVFLPYGGFYPESWYVERRPWTRSLEKLWQRHSARCDAHGSELVALDADPLSEFNQEQRDLERLNRELGFLSSPDEAAEEGRITSAGRFRMWAEMWMLSYFGRPRRY